MQHLYVTTTIPYVNAPPHVGFALELVQADALARYHRLEGTVTRLQTGTDENAFKNVLSAREQGLPVQELVDRNAARFRELASALDVSLDRFVRTTTPEHHRAVAAFLDRLRSEDLHRRRYQGLYCPGCEDFFLERDLSGGTRCPEHGAVVVEVEEENVFFRLSAYQQTLSDLITSGRLGVVPEARRTEVLRFIERGLEDISISRDAERSQGWGVSFPGDPSQVVYVWIDALVNYLSGLGFPDGDGWRSFWGEGSRRVHVIGKNVWKFHAVYWPALLLSAGLALPDEIVVHGFLTEEGRKISKSSGGVADPLGYVRRFGADALRLFLLRHVRPFDDADFSEARLEEVYVADLANGLGNLVSRLTKLCERFGVAAATDPFRRAAPGRYHAHLEAYRFDRALDVLWGELARLDREIDEARPWEEDPDRPSIEARTRLARWAGELRWVANRLTPFLPATAARITGLLGGATVRAAPPLFPRMASGTARI